MMAPICSGRTPAMSMALRQACTDIDRGVSPSTAQWRSRMPVRCSIHSGVESIIVHISSLVTTREPR